MTLDQYGLMNLSKEKLIALTCKLIDRLPEKERVDIVLNWVGPQAALAEAGAYDGKHLGEKVEVFCKECLE